MLAVAPGAAQDAAHHVGWNEPAAPFRLVGNVHHVGTEGFLIAPPRRHDPIDGALPESAPPARPTPGGSA